MISYMKWPWHDVIEVSKDSGHEILDFEAKAQYT